MAENNPPDDGPGVERTITLRAVVAIAMTLLILPLVEVVNEIDVTDLATLWAENGQLLQSFVISFLVIYAFWTAHQDPLPPADRRRPTSGALAGSDQHVLAAGDRVPALPHRDGRYETSTRSALRSTSAPCSSCPHSPWP